MTFKDDVIRGYKLSCSILTSLTCWAQFTLHNVLDFDIFISKRLLLILDLCLSVFVSMYTLFIRNMSSYSNFLCWGVNSIWFLQENISSENSTVKNMRFIATKFYIEKSSMSNSTQKMRKGKYWRLYGEFYMLGEISRDLQKMQILVIICM